MNWRRIEQVAKAVLLVALVAAAHKRQSTLADLPLQALRPFGFPHSWIPGSKAQVGSDTVLADVRH